MAFISANQVFVDKTRANMHIRVIAVQPGGEWLYLFEMSEKNALPERVKMVDFLGHINAGELEPCSEEPVFAIVPNDSTLTEASKNRRDKRYEIIKSIITDFEFEVLDPSLRHEILSEVSKVTNTGRNHLYEWLRLWWRRGQIPNALVPSYRNCGASGKARHPGDQKLGRPPFIAGTERKPGVNVTPEIALKLQAGAASLKKGRSWSEAFEDNALIHFLSTELSDGRKIPMPADERPTIQQFRYHVCKILSPKEVERATKGAAWFERNRAERSGFTRDIPSGPGAIFQIDATIANIWLRSRIDLDRLIGRPVLYLVTDQSSGVIVGFEVSLSTASWEVAKLALANAFSDKVASCAAAGIEITSDMWPCHHIPKQLTGDRHWDVLGANPGKAGLGLKINIANLPAYRPDLKSLVEGRFQWLDAKTVQWAPGATHGRKRGDPDDRPHKLDGFYDLDAFRKLIILAIVKHNNTLRIKDPPTWYPMISGGSPTPLEVWNYGCVHQGMPQVQEARTIKANLLPVANAKSTDGGLKVGRLFFAPTDPEQRKQFDRIVGRKWGYVEVRYDPRDVSSILIPKPSGEFDTYRLVPKDRRFEGWTSDEVAEAFARRRAVDSLAEDIRMNHEVWHRGQVAQLDVQARAAAAEARDPAAPQAIPRRRRRLAGDRELRKAEEQGRRSEEAWTKVAKASNQLLPASIRPPAMPSEPIVTEPRETNPVALARKALKPNKMDLINDVAKQAQPSGTRKK